MTETKENGKMSEVNENGKTWQMNGKEKHNEAFVPDPEASTSSIGDEDNGETTYAKIRTTKPQMNQPEYDEFYGCELRPQRTVRDACRDCRTDCKCNPRCVGKTLLGFLPFLRIMKEYQKDWISLDLIAGLTIGIMQIPQGLAYSLLAELDPVVGLYVSFFPVLIYYFFGTSRHVSLGTFAVVSLMVGTTVEKFDCSQGGNGGDDTATTMSPVTTDMYGNTTASDGGKSAEEMACKLGIATALTLLAGLIQLFMGLVKLGFVVRYLSVPLTRGFTTGCSMHVFTSQVKYIVGISTDRYSGPLKLVYTYRDIFRDIAEINWAAIIVSFICMIILWIVKEYANPPFKRKFKAPIPIDLIIVILGTVASFYGDFEDKYKLAVVGDIETGIPAPKFPPMERLGDVALDALFIAIVAFAISVSMVQLYADKYSYDVDPNQELVAHGLCNSISANFNCYVMCVSLSRSAVLDSIGVKTQVYALWSCGLILLIIYFVAPYFAPLPNCVLAAIIVIALKGLFMQFKDIPKYWKISGTDLSVWIVTFVAVVIMDVGYGLVIGVLYCLITVVGRTQKPYASILGRMPNTTDYKDVKVYEKAEQIDDVKVFRFDNALYYANKDHFTDSLYELSGCNPKALKLAIAKCKRKREKDVKGGMSETEAEIKWPTPTASIHHVVLDCSVMGYTDAMGVIALRQVLMDYKEVGVTVVYAGLNEGVREMLESGGFFEKARISSLYPTVHDAVYDTLNDKPEEQLKIMENVVEAPYVAEVPSMNGSRKRTLTSSKFRTRTLSQMELAIPEEDLKRDRSESQGGYYNMALVVDDVMDIDKLDEEFRTAL